MCRLPYRAPAALLSACMSVVAASTLCAAASTDLDGFGSRSVVMPVDAPSALHLHRGEFELAADGSDGGEKAELSVETALEAAYANGLPIPKPFIDKVAT